jgi:hypothetical protein
MEIRLHIRKMVFYGFAAYALASVGGVPAFAAAVTDPAGDILPTFDLAFRGDLDLTSADVNFDGSKFVFKGTALETVGESENFTYVFGLNRGMGTPKFANIGNPHVMFDATFVLNPSGASSVRDLISGTTTQINDVAISGNSFSGTVPLALLPSQGFAPNDYMYSLWTSVGAPSPQNDGISDFAPNDSVSLVTSTATPEPGTLSLFAMAGVGAAAILRRRNSRKQRYQPMEL